MSTVQNNLNLNDKKLNAVPFSSTDDLELSEVIMQQFNKLSVLWPVSNFVASNPLLGYEKVNIQDAINDIYVYDDYFNKYQELRKINSVLIKWLSVYFDDGQARLSMPNKELGLFKAVLSLLPYDNEIKFSMDVEKLIKMSSQEVIYQLLEELQVNKNSLKDFIQFNFLQLPGWGAYIRYKSKYVDKTDDVIFDYLSLRLVLTKNIWPNISQYLYWNQIKNFCAEKTIQVMQHINNSEREYQRYISQFLDISSKTQVNRMTKQYEAQFLFCIDARSEPMRRTIESLGNYETFGCAGFFNLMININSKGLSYKKNSLPAILEPRTKVDLRDLVTHKEYKSKKRNLEWSKIYKSLKYSLSTPLVLVEILGPLFGLMSVAKTFFTKALYLINKLFYIDKQHESSSSHIKIAIDTDEQAEIACSLLKSIGFTNNFSNYIIVCGHKSYNVNNIYHNALNCGACQGENGLYNSKIICSILNNKIVRNILNKKGISIPDATQFIPALHNTTTDEIVLYEPVVQKDNLKLSRVKKQLNEAKLLVSTTRVSNLIGTEGVKARHNLAEVLAHDWSTIRPEWGLAKNAAFIIGPRQMTVGTDLQGRAFLHSYDYKIDANAQILNSIINGPVAVAYWINMQYLFSTLDNKRFGSGCKTTQNLTGKIGVMQGNLSDLKIGLPLQSVYKDSDIYYHEPIRLNLFIYAPINNIKHLIDSNNFLRNLIKNHWIHVFCLDPINKYINKVTPTLDFEKMIMKNYQNIMV